MVVADAVRRRVVALRKSPTKYADRVRPIGLGHRVDAAEQGGAEHLGVQGAVELRHVAGRVQDRFVRSLGCRHAARRYPAWRVADLLRADRGERLAGLGVRVEHLADRRDHVVPGRPRSRRSRSRCSARRPGPPRTPVDERPQQHRQQHAEQPGRRAEAGSAAAPGRPWDSAVRAGRAAVRRTPPSSQPRPPTAASVNSHCRPPTTRHQSGLRSIPRSVLGDRPVQGVGQVGHPRPGGGGQRGRPDRRQRRGRAGRDRAHGQADRRLLGGVGVRQRRPRNDFGGHRVGARRAGQVQSAQRVGPQPAQSADHRPPGRGGGPVAVRARRPRRRPPAPRPRRRARRTAAGRSPGRPRPRPPAARSSRSARRSPVEVAAQPAQRGLPLGHRLLQRRRAARSACPAAWPRWPAPAPPPRPSSSSSRLRSPSTISVSDADSRSAWLSTTT